MCNEKNIYIIINAWTFNFNFKYQQNKIEINWKIKNEPRCLAFGLFIIERYTDFRRIRSKWN